MFHTHDTVEGCRHYYANRHHIPRLQLLPFRKLLIHTSMRERSSHDRQWGIGQSSTIRPRDHSLDYSYQNRRHLNAHVHHRNTNHYFPTAHGTSSTKLTCDQRHFLHPNLVNWICLECSRRNRSRILRNGPRRQKEKFNNTIELWLKYRIEAFRRKNTVNRWKYPRG